MSDTSYKSLVVIFHSQVSLALLEKDPDKTLEIGDQVYRDVGLGDFNGFYDWLRDRTKSPIGIRFWPFKEARFIIDKVRPYSYVTVDKDQKSLLIYFALGRKYEPRYSADQDFGNNRILSSAENADAVTFGLGVLTAQEIEALKSLDAFWVTR